MNARIPSRHPVRALVAAVCILTVAAPRSTLACMGSSGPVCVINPTACLKSMVLTKSVPTVVVFPPGGPALFNVPINLFMTCPTTNNCGNVCTNLGGPVSASITVNLYPGPPCPPGGPLPPPTVSSTISTMAGTMAIPLCTPAGANNNYSVPVTVPAGTPLGMYCVVGMAMVTFPGGMVLSQSGDTVVCLVEEAPDKPGEPRLDMQLLTESFVRMAPGDQAVARYRITNNDRTQSVHLIAIATSRQAAVRPQGGNERDGVFAISMNRGDDFPIMFNPSPTACIPLPEHPYTQEPMTLQVPTLKPGDSTVIAVGVRSYGQCADGSCSESTLRIQGTWDDGGAALACAGMSLLVDTSVPSQGCGSQVNDCNRNGIPDSLDIASRRSADQNFNAMPDECEELIAVPVFASVNPQDPMPGQPIEVQVAFNEIEPMANVWADGNPLIRTQLFGAPLWFGTIPADSRPGPQAVYFLGKDSLGGLASYVATYEVQPPSTAVDLPQGCSSLANNYGDQPLSSLIPDPPDGTQVYKWDAASQSYRTFTFLAGFGWDPGDPMIANGEGIFICTPESLTLTLTGQIVPAPPRTRFPDGLHLVGCRTPEPCAFTELMGFPPRIGDRVHKYDTTTPNVPTQPSSTHQFTASGWTPSVPVLDPGKGAFVELGAGGQAPEMTDVSPPRGASGDILTITGQGFGTDPDDLCVGLMSDPPVAMRVLWATDTRITVRVGAIPSNAVPGRISIMRGQGNSELFQPVLTGIEVVNNWTWRGTPPAGLSPNDFTPVYVPPDPGVRWFFGEVVDGNLCIYLSGDWGTDARVWVEVHLLSGGVWYDQQTCDILQGSGTTLDCANKLKDIVVCGLQQGQGVLLPATVDPQAGGIVKVTLRGPNNEPITAGSISVCTTPPRVPVITSVRPSQGVATGDIITIEGSGFGNNPNNICVIAASPMTPPLPPKPWDPLRVLSASDTRLTVRLGTVPPPMPGMPPPVLMVQLGEGNMGPITPIFPSIRGASDTWVWTSREPAAQAPGTFQTVYTPPHTNVQYFFGEVTNGVICVYIRGDWVVNSRVTVETHFNAGNTHYDMQERTAVFANGGTALECAQYIKDLIVCAFGQRAGVLLPADVEPVAGTDLVKVTVRSPNNEPITSGMLTICCIAPRPPVITDIQPRIGGEGDIITIIGRGFDPNPDNNCVVARFGDTAVPLRALDASETRITARLGPVPSNAPPARIMVASGEGVVGRFVPIFDDLAVEEDVWVWRGFEAGAAAPLHFIPVHRPPPSRTVWFFAELVNGRLCTYIRGNWVSNSTVRITARAHTATEKLDLDAPTTRFLGAGTTLQCAYRIADIIRCAFLQQAGADVFVQVDPQPDGSIKLTVSRADGQPIVWGLLTICVTQPAPPIVITDVVPRTIAEGNLVRIIGSGFGNDPDNLCVVMRFGDTAVPLRAVQATDDEIVARVGVVPPDAQPGPIMVGLGRGDVGRFRPIFDDIELLDPVWVWRGIEPGAVGPFDLIAQPSRPPFGVKWFFATLNDGRLCTYIEGNWRSNTLVQITARAHTTTEKLDLEAPRTRLLGEGTAAQCATRLKDIIQCAFRQQAGATVNVDIEPQADGRVKITVSRADGQPIVWGLLTICVTQPPAPPVIAGIWDLENRGLWRKEVRSRELARWYRHYEWTVDSRLWLNRRAEGVWITGQAIRTFTCSSHCLLRNPNGPGFWRIWRTFTQTDVRRFRLHYRITWVGHLNPLVAAAAPQTNRFAVAIDHVEMVLPMEPTDPNPDTPANEAVMIVDENGEQHFLGDPGFEMMPDTEQNPNGFQLATTAASTDRLPPAEFRTNEEMSPEEMKEMGQGNMAEIQPGVWVMWLLDDHGNVLVDVEGDPSPDPMSPGVLGNMKNFGLVAPPTGEAGNELPIRQANTPLQLYCWALGPNGEVLGAAPGEAVIGPPDAAAGERIVAGAAAPMDPTVRELQENPDGTVEEVRDPNAQPVDLALVEEGPPTPEELDAFNANIARQIPGFVPLQPPFNICIRDFKVRRIWGIDRRVVFDTWFHHWYWKLSHHFTLRRGAYRVWLTRQTLTEFHSSHHHYVFGQPPAWQMYSITNVRFFRVCYRVIAPQLNVVRLKIDQLHMVVPVDPSNPNSQLMLLSTQHDENELFQEVPPAVLAGLEPDPLPVDEQGVFVEPIPPVSTMDLLAGAPAVFSTGPVLRRGMLDADIMGNTSAANELNNSQLPLYCWVLQPDGTIGMETFTDVVGTAAIGDPIQLAITPTAAIPVFSDEMGNSMENPTMFELNIVAEPDINVMRIGDRVEIRWAREGVLQAADEVTGPYSDVPGAMSPVLFDLTEPMRYFRIAR